jgi:hypothetical protein
LESFKREGVETLTDFANLYDQDEHTAELKKKWLSIEQFAQLRVHYSRLKSVWELANAVRDNIGKDLPSTAQAVPVREEMDWELPLTTSERDEMDKEWKKRYEIVVAHQLFPGEALRNRVWREFRKWTMTTTEIGKMKSTVMEHAPRVVYETPISDLLSLTSRTSADYSPTDVVGYYWGLRVLAYAWGQAGNYMVDSKKNPGTQVLMMPWADALNYADRFLQVAMSSGLHQREVLHWAQTKDRLTRSMMAGHVRERWPAGEALEKALVDTASDWSTIKGQQVLGVHNAVAELGDLRHTGGSSKGGGKRQRSRSRGRDQDRPAKGDRKGGDQRKVGNVANMTKDKKRLCGAFNSKKGCKQHAGKCPNGMHACGYITSADGRVCMQQGHGYAGHRK